LNLVSQEGNHQFSPDTGCPGAAEEFVPSLKQLFSRKSAQFRDFRSNIGHVSASEQQHIDALVGQAVKRNETRRGMRIPVDEI
jgi:hypothetical protein